VKRFGPREWDAYWSGKERIDEVYSNRDRLVGRLADHTHLEGKRVLEVGAGSGRDGLALAEMGATVYPLDFSIAALLSIRGRNSLGSTIEVCGEASALPLADESIDVVFSQGFLEHVADPECVLAESHRVLRKGGVLLVDVPQTFHPYTVAKKVLLACGTWFAGWETQYTMGALCSLVERVGFRVEVRYGDWLQPSLLYRSVRHLGHVLGWAQLPLYPQRSRLTSAIAAAIHRLLDDGWLQLHTAACIGVICRK